MKRRRRRGGVEFRGRSGLAGAAVAAGRCGAAGAGGQGRLSKKGRDAGVVPLTANRRSAVRCSKVQECSERTPSRARELQECSTGWRCQ
jgi:hypothetical protein